jgi:PAS domain S-box-containing protein
VGTASVVAVLHAPRSAATLAALLAELDPDAVSVVGWGVDSAPAALQAEFHEVVRRAGFALRSWAGRPLLEVGCLYMTPRDRPVWFEGRRLHVGLQRQNSFPFDRLLQSLVRVWGGRCLVMATEALNGDGERGLLAVRRAGGVVLGPSSADEDTAGPRSSELGRSELRSIESASIESASTESASTERGEQDDGGGPASARPPRSQRLAPPAFRVHRLFPFSSTVLAQLRAAAAVAVQRAVQRDRVRIWVPACKTGGLVYAVAMILSEAVAGAASPPRVQVFGTDQDEEALAVARMGRYPVQAALGMDAELRGRYTLDEGSTIRVSEALREVCVFSSHKLTRNAPFSRMDLIVCHRIFDGLPLAWRDDVVDGLYFALRDEGLLFAIGNRKQFMGDRFEPMPGGYLQPRPTRAKALRGLVQWRGSQPVSTDLESLPPSQRPLEPSSLELSRGAPVAVLPRVRTEIEQFVRALDVPLILLDRQLGVLEMSEEAMRLFGLSSADRGLALEALAPRLPAGIELLHAARHALRSGTPRELTTRSGDRAYLARVSAGQRFGGRTVTIAFTDVSTLGLAADRVLVQPHQQAAVARVGELALRADLSDEVFEDALSMLFGNIPSCCAGLIAELVDDAPTLSVLASLSLGEDPLRTLHHWGEPFGMLLDALKRVTGPRATPSHAATWVASRLARQPAGDRPESSPGSWFAPSGVSAGIACPIQNEGTLLGVIALYSRQGGMQDAEHHSFVQGMANVLGGVIARQRTRRGLALELEVSSVAASAADLTELGDGVAGAFRSALGTESLEIWTSSTAALPPIWQRRYPDGGETFAPPPWSDPVIEVAVPTYRAPASPERLGELWVPLATRTGERAVLRAFGPSLRQPHRELSLALERSCRTLAAFFERLQMLDALRRLAASQRESIAELEAFYASLPVGVSIHDSSGAVRRVNRELSDPDGAPPSTRSALLAELHSEELPGWVTRVLRTGEPIRDLELSLTQGSDERWWLCNLAAIRDSSGTVFGVSTVVHDITRLKRVEADLREVDRKKDDYLAILGHELRNPLAAIRNVAELLNRVESPSPQLSSLQKILDRQTLQTTKLIDGLLDVARITHGKVELETAPLELVDLVRQVVEDRRHQFREHRLELRLPEGQLWTQADRVRFVQIIDNLLSNALKFTPPGGRVSVVLRGGPGHGSLCISDDGMGIEAELLPNIFEPFRQGRATSPSAPGLGLGLGLSLVKGLSELHGFDVLARSEGLGRGASFQIDFPRIEAPAPQRRESSIQARRLQLLLVEDNADIAETLAELLGASGHSVQHASSGEAALSILHGYRPDIILCDIGLPGMDGVALAERVRNNPELHGVKLVAMTGYGDALTRLRIEEAGFDLHLIKPVQHDMLVSCLSRLSMAPPLLSELG